MTSPRVLTDMSSTPTNPYLYNPESLRYCGMQTSDSAEFRRQRNQSLVLSTVFYAISILSVNLLLWTASLNKSYIC